MPLALRLVKKPRKNVEALIRGTRTHARTHARTHRHKWSLKYKRSINCKHPKGFSQKQHCKYGRKNRTSKK